MYNYSDIKAVHLEITTKCQARCPMCPRRISGGVLNPFMNINEITLDQFKKWFNVDFIKNLNYLTMCGNLGDPIMARDTVKIFEYIRSINQLMALEMNTNGSARSKEWWNALAKLNVKVIFGIDGLEDTHHLYRVNTNWKRIIKNAQMFINAGGNAKWDMLAFQHNEEQINQCRELSKQLGFNEFEVKHTSRFTSNKLHVLDDTGKTAHVIYPTLKSLDILSMIKNNETVSKPYIKCKAIQNSQIYVSANGNVSPCCWLDLSWMPHTVDSRNDYMDKVGYFPNLNETSLEEIFENKFFNSISSCWNNEGLVQCSKQCGTVDRFNEQFNV